AMISGAYDYNRQAEAYNQRLRQRVNAVQQSKSKSDAKAALTEAQRQRDAMATRIQQRNATARDLPSGYSSRYLESNQELEAQKRATDSMVAKLKSISQAE
ncbi:MAG: hypothetical protein KDM63_21075, partial [Verrucomicrobiae bacterium]|nr:hypothetical protein [Verrucomicrobiae bacterium]